jgi:signal transduction histidine kinase
MKQPLLLKVFFVLLITGILILSLVAVHLTLVSNENKTPLFVRQGLQTYAESLATEIGNPPNFERALQLSGDLNIDIRIRTKAGLWKSSAQLRDSQAPSFQIRSRGVIYSFFLHTENPWAPLIRQLFFIIGGLCIILAVSYAVLRSLFKPLSRILTGVKAISEGDLGFRIPTKAGEEFEYVGTAFNQMTRTIQDMLKAREQLLLDLSHDLRSPITRMQVSTEFVQDAPLKKSLKEDLSEMESLVHSILEGARLGNDAGASLEASDFDLALKLEKLIEKVGVQAPGIVFSKPAQPMPYRGDWALLRRAFSNLLENALKYSSQQQRAVEVRLVAEDLAYVIEIQDFGIGIGAAEQNLIFEPFYRVDKARTPGAHGYGLGLSLTKKIIEAHGGHLQVSSALGEGSTFEVKLPKALHASELPL